MSKEQLQERMVQAATRIAVLESMIKECPFDSTFKNMLADAKAEFKDVVKSLATFQEAIAA